MLRRDGGRSDCSDTCAMSAPSRRLLEIDGFACAGTGLGITTLGACTVCGSSCASCFPCALPGPLSLPPFCPMPFRAFPFCHPSQESQLLLACLGDFGLGDLGLCAYGAQPCFHELASQVSSLQGVPAYVLCVAAAAPHWSQIWLLALRHNLQWWHHQLSPLVAITALA